MRLLPALLCFVVLLHTSYAPPVSPEKENGTDSKVKDDLEEYMEYHRYLKEVVQTLENDPEFRERLEKADEDDIRSGKIAEELDFVNHNVRTKLDEIKRRELERLRHLATKQNEINQEQESKLKATNEHLDHANPYTFEVEDLKKLIQKTTADLEAADKQRKQEFKEYEMQKEFEKNQKLETMDDNQKKQYIEKVKVEEEAKKHHQPLHHPGSKQQLEEVWEKQDQMDQQFDPKAFFMMHDVDGNGVWDADEVKALFIKELDKIYGPNGPNKDLHERAEEMERMREHVFGENDRNKDGLIDFNEFMTETQKANFNQDEGWKPIDENQIYTQAEYEQFQRSRLDEVRYLQSRGLIDAQGRPLPGAQHQIHQAVQQYRAIQMHGPQMPGQVYSQGNPQGQIPQGHHVDPNQVYQMPQGVSQGHPNQGLPQGHHNQGHPNQGVPQGHPNQVPQGYQGQGYQAQAPQGYPAQGQQGYPPQGQPQQGYQPNQPYQQAPNQNVPLFQAPQAQPQNLHNAGQAPQFNDQQMPVLGGQPAAQQQAPNQAARQDIQAQQQAQAPQGNPPQVQSEQHSNPPVVANQQVYSNPSPVQEQRQSNPSPQTQGQQVHSQNEIPAVDGAHKV